MVGEPRSLKIPCATRLNQPPTKWSTLKSCRCGTELTSDPRHIAPVRKTIERLTTALGFTAAAAADVGLAVNEALANVIRHAYGGQSGKPIVITVDCESSDLRVTIRDWGCGINPAGIAARPRDPAIPGGLGMVCLRTLMDQAEYTPQPDGMLLTMIKRRR